MQDPTSVVHAWISGFNAAGHDSILALYAPDAVLWGTFATELIQTTQGLATYFEQALQGTPPPRAELHSLVVQSFGTVAVASGAYDLQLNKAAQRIAFRARFTFTLSHTANGWLITNHHSSVMPTKAGLASPPCANNSEA